MHMYTHPYNPCCYHSNICGVKVQLVASICEIVGLPCNSEEGLVHVLAGYCFTLIDGGFRYGSSKHTNGLLYLLS